MVGHRDFKYLVLGLLKIIIITKLCVCVCVCVCVWFYIQERELWGVLPAFGGSPPPITNETSDSARIKE